MRKLLSLVLGSTALAIVATTSVASAGTTCHTNACEAARSAASKPAYHGPIAKTTSKMVCANVYTTKKKTEVVWIDGPDVNGDDIASQRPDAVKWRKFMTIDGTTIYVGESCIKAAYVADLDVITICNGLKRNDGNHSVFKRRFIDKALRGTRLQVSLLGTRLTARVEKVLD